MEEQICYFSEQEQLLVLPTLGCSYISFLTATRKHCTQIILYLVKHFANVIKYFSCEYYI